MKPSPCPHCTATGGLYTESDRYGSYISCRICGHVEDLNGVPAPGVPSDGTWLGNIDEIISESPKWTGTLAGHHSDEFLTRLEEVRDRFDSIMRAGGHARPMAMRMVVQEVARHGGPVLSIRTISRYVTGMHSHVPLGRSAKYR